MWRYKRPSIGRTDKPSSRDTRTPLKKEAAKQTEFRVGFSCPVLLVGRGETPLEMLPPSLWFTVRTETCLSICSFAFTGHSFAWSALLAPHYLVRTACYTCAPLGSFAHSLAHLLIHSQSYGRVNVSMSQFVQILSYSAPLQMRNEKWVKWEK